MGRKNREGEKQRLKPGSVSAGAAVQHDRANDPAGHLHARVQTRFRRLPRPLPLRKSRSSPSEAGELLRRKPPRWRREGALQSPQFTLAERLPAVRDKGALLRRLPTAPDKSLLPRCSEDARHNGGPPPRLQDVGDKGFPCCTGAEREIAVRASASGYFCREKFPG